MSARAPQAIYDVWDAIHAHIPSAVLSGIVGDVNHSFGYHLARRDLPGSDYSVQLALDKQGASDCASALDVSLSPTLMKTCTERLLTAAKAKDPRLKGLREFCGTLNGTQTYPWDLSTDSSEGVDTWDDSHLWHIHLSFYRAYADEFSVLAPIADVFGGVSLAPTPTRKREKDMLVIRIDLTDKPKAAPTPKHGWYTFNGKDLAPVLGHVGKVNNGADIKTGLGQAEDVVVSYSQFIAWGGTGK